MEDNWQTLKLSLRKRAKYLLTSKSFSDCEFLVGSEKVKIRCHKLFLAMSSPVFQAMFYGEMAVEGCVEIVDIEADAFRGLLQYIYTDRVDFDSCTHASTVYSGATKYLLPVLQEICIKYMADNITADSACLLYEFAQFHGKSDITDMCLKVFQENTQSVLQSLSFFDSKLSTVLTIFEQHHLEVDSELRLFEGLEGWTNKEAARQDVAVESLSLSVTAAISRIKFLMMTAEEFTKGPALSPLLSSDEKLAILMNINTPGVIDIPARINTSKTRYNELQNESDIYDLKSMYAAVEHISKDYLYAMTLKEMKNGASAETESQNLESDGDFESGETSSDDEETIAEADEEDEKEGLNNPRALKLLKKESQVPLEYLLKDYLDKREDIVLEEDDDATDASSESNEEEVQYSEKYLTGNEETIQEKEEADGKVDHNQALEDLKK